MVIGNGLVASAFRDSDREDVVLFASGVSNSLETDKSSFKREKDLILKVMNENPDKLFIYFSTCSIYDSSKNDSPYVHHKLNMEHLISEKCSAFLILRVSNAVGKGGNTHLLMNYLFDSIENEKSMKIHKKATRNLIDIEDVKNILFQIIIWNDLNKIYNIAYLRNFGISEIVHQFEEELGKTTDKDYLDMGESYSIDIRDIKNYFKKEEEPVYLRNLIRKYYKKN